MNFNFDKARKFNWSINLRIEISLQAFMDLIVKKSPFRCISVSEGFEILLDEYFVKILEKEKLVY